LDVLIVEGDNTLDLTVQQTSFKIHVTFSHKTPTFSALAILPKVQLDGK
jgi:hypothetical protein